MNRHLNRVLLRYFFALLCIIFAQPVLCSGKFKSVEVVIPASVFLMEDASGIQQPPIQEFAIKDAGQVIKNYQYIFRRHSLTEPPSADFEELSTENVTGTVYGMASTVQDEGEKDFHFVFLGTHSDFLVTSPLSRERRRSVSDKPVSVSHPGAAPGESLHFVYRLDVKVSSLARDAELKHELVIADVLKTSDVTGPTFEKIKKNWLGDTVLQTARQLNVFNMLTTEDERKEEQPVSITVQGEIDGNQNCILRFRASPALPKGQNYMPAFSGSDEELYASMDDSNDLNLMFFCGEREFLVCKWNDAMHAPQNSNAAYKLSINRSAHSQSPFFIEGWHVQPHAELKSSFEYSFSPQLWTTSWVEGESPVHVLSTQTSSSSISSAGTPALMFSYDPVLPNTQSIPSHSSASSLQNRSNSGGGVGGLARPSLNKQMSRSAQNLHLAFQGLSVVNQDMLELGNFRLRDAVRHCVFHNKTPAFAYGNPENEARLAYQCARDILAGEVERLRVYKTAKKESVKEKGLISKMIALQKDMDAKLGSGAVRGDRSFCALFQEAQSKIQELKMVDGSGQCKHCKPGQVFPGILMYTSAVISARGGK